MLSVELTNEEWMHIKDLRETKKKQQALKQKQTSCKHPRKIHEGRFGHNGDDWYRCPDCKKEWCE